VPPPPRRGGADRRVAPNLLVDHVGELREVGRVEALRPVRERGERGFDGVAREDRYGGQRGRHERRIDGREHEVDRLRVDDPDLVEIPEGSVEGSPCQIL
jgi:hypothetical protein